jgi:hypothetical protein
MAHGQFAPGHKKLGGRKAGQPNHASVAHRRAILASGLSPIDYLTSVYRDPGEPTSVRVDAARTVCAYVYPKLSSVDVNGREGQPLVVQVIRFGDNSVGEHRSQPPAIASLPVIDMASVAAEGAVTDAVVAPVVALEVDEADEC